MWPSNSLLSAVGIDIPIIQAPMAGAHGVDLVVAVSDAGGLGSLPCAMLNEQQVEEALVQITHRTSNPFSVNFFCHTPELPDPSRDTAWMQQLAGYYEEFQLDPAVPPKAVNRQPFNEGMCTLIERYRPNVVSFHFGLPDQPLLDRVKACGCVVLSSATTVAEATWLETQGCDVIVAQGYEAGGHRGIFLSEDVTTQPGTMSLVPQVTDAVNVPVVAAGGIADGRGITAAFALGAAGVQIGTGYLLTSESLVSDVYRHALRAARDNDTALTNVFSGRPARGIVNRVVRELGPLSEHAPVFPTAGAAVAPLKAAAEKAGSADFSSVWAGQSVTMAQEVDARALTQSLAADALALMHTLSP